MGPTYYPAPLNQSSLWQFQEQIARDLGRLAEVTDTPMIYLKEKPMNEYESAISQFTRTINQAFEQRRAKTGEQEFQELEVVDGDRVRLTEATRRNPYEARTVVKDGSSLEGKVIGIKVRDGKTQLRIAGFGHTGPSKAGGQHVWFPVENYKIEVLHKVYRLTDDDRLVAATAGMAEERWIKLSDEARDSYRGTYSDRIAKIKALLAPTVGNA